MPEQIDTPLVLSAQVRGQEVVTRCCPQGLRARVFPGMSVAFARVRLPQLEVLRFDPAADYAELEQLAPLLDFASPRVGIDYDLYRSHTQGALSACSKEHYGLHVDLQGTERLHGNAQIVANKIAAKLIARGYSCRIGFGPTLGTAWATSRYLPHPCNHYQQKQALQMPIAALRLNSTVVEELRCLGIENINALGKFSVKELSLRFGHEVVKRIDEFCGVLEERTGPIRRKSRVYSACTYEPALERPRQISKAIEQLVDDLQHKLEDKSLQASTFSLYAQCIDEHTATHKLKKDFSFHRPAYEKDHITQVLATALEPSRLPGALRALALKAFTTQAPRREQTDLQDKHSESPVYKREHDTLLNSLIATLGSEGVKTLRYHNAYVPERSFSFVPLENGTSEQVTSPPLAQRPSYLLDTPVPLQVTALLPDHPPARIIWEDKPYTILRGTGPERIAIDWWNTPEQCHVEQREYFSVQDHTGRWLWIYRHIPSHEWHLHGLWV